MLRRSDAEPFRSTHNLVFLGTDAAARFGRDASAWPLRSARGKDGDQTYSLGPCVSAGRPLAAAFLAPASSPAADSTRAASPPPDPPLDLVVTATDQQSLAALATSTFATNQAHTRAPFSNMLPDFFIVDGKDFEWLGHGGVLAAGYFDGSWGVAPQSAYFQC